MQYMLLNHQDFFSETQTKIVQDAPRIEIVSPWRVKSVPRAALSSFGITTCRVNSLVCLEVVQLSVRS